jgi:hypothetical protein
MTSDDKFRLDRNDQGHDFVDQSKIDFDPDDGLYSGTAVEGNSEIAGPHMDTDSGELTDLGEPDQPDQPAQAGGRHREATR